MICWKCQKKTDLSEKKVPFRATCNHCGYDLHVCKNCKYFMPGKPNDCNVPNTENVSDREKHNFCEEFSPKSGSESSPPSNDSVFRLFGEKPPSSTSFDDLF